MFDSTFWVVLGRVRWREGVFKFSAPAHIFDATQVHRLRETLTFLACAHMSHATYIYAIRWAWTHFLVLALAHVCLADLHVTLVILLVFELANMFDARQSTSSPGNANVPWVRTHVGCYVRYTIPFLLLKQLSLVLCFYTVMWTVCLGYGITCAVHLKRKGCFIFLNLVRAKPSHEPEDTHAKRPQP